MNSIFFVAFTITLEPKQMSIFNLLFDRNTMLIIR